MSVGMKRGPFSGNGWNELNLRFEPDRVTGVAILDVDSEGMKFRREAFNDFLKLCKEKQADYPTIAAPDVPTVWHGLIYPLMKHDPKAVTASIGASEFKIYGQRIQIHSSDSRAMAHYGMLDPVLIFGKAAPTAINFFKDSPQFNYDFRLFDCESLKSREEGEFLIEVHDARSNDPRASLSRLEGMGNPKGVKEMFSWPSHSDYPPNIEEYLMIAARIPATT